MKKRKWIVFVALAVLLLAQVGLVQAGTANAPATGLQTSGKTPALGEAPPPGAEGSGSIGIQSYTPGDSVAESDEEFVLDSYGSLDRYTFRNGSPIRFPIRITRYFGQVDSNGHLAHPENIQGQKVLLTLRVWDVDQDYAGSDFAPEVDTVYFNGEQVGILSGSNGQWSTFTVELPVSKIKFPDLSASGGVVPAENWVEVNIDTANVGVCECWAVTVDWGRLVAKGIRPTVLVHGFMSSASTWATWENTYGPNAGLPLMSFSFANNHGSWLAHASEEAAQISQAKQKFGVEKLNIVGHSKGGLDSRAYLAMGGQDVKRLVMLGTPNGGSPLADIAKLGGILSPAVGLVSLIGEPALTEITVTYMQLIGNQIVGPNPNTRYYTVAGDWHGLFGASNPLIPGSDDGVVGVSSVETLPYTTSLGHSSSFHTSMTSGATEWNLAKSQVVTTTQAWPVGGRLALAGGIMGGPTPVSLTSLTGFSLAGGSQTSSVTVEAGAPVILGALYGSGTLDLTLTTPSGATISGSGTGVELVKSTDPTLGLSYILYRLAAPAAGVYQLNVTAAPGSTVKYLALGAAEGGAELVAAPRSAFVAAGAPVAIEAGIRWNGSAVLPLTMDARVQQPGGPIDTITLVDDGTGGDTAAGDGIYTGSYTAPAAGTYGVGVVAKSSDPAHPLERYTGTLFQVLSGSDHFVGNISHKGTDLNGDGLFDYLSASVGVATAMPGNYLVTAQVTDAGGKSLVRASSRVSLATGTSSVTLNFDGRSLGESNFSGNLILTDLALIREDGSAADFRAPAATLAGYSPSQFQRQRVRILPGIADQALDTNGNGLFDQLVIRIPVDVLDAGYYDVNGRLMDSQNAEIAWAGNTVYLSPGQSTVTLTYSGKAIGENGIDGPYFVRDFSMYARSGTSRGVNVYDLYTTGAYTVDQFEGFSGNLESLLTKIARFREAGSIANDGIARSLSAKVEAAQAAEKRGEKETARNILAALINEISAQDGKHIAAASAADLVRTVQAIINRLK
ncbi:MAG TPA: alpha/beta fold hydrolase [Symbiobacteriaceae bacterium]